MSLETAHRSTLEGIGSLPLEHLPDLAEIQKKFI